MTESEELDNNIRSAGERKILGNLQELLNKSNVVLPKGTYLIGGTSDPDGALQYIFEQRNKVSELPDELNDRPFLLEDCYSPGEVKRLVNELKKQPFVGFNSKVLSLAKMYGRVPLMEENALAFYQVELRMQLSKFAMQVNEHIQAALVREIRKIDPACTLDNLVASYGPRLTIVSMTGQSGKRFYLDYNASAQTGQHLLDFDDKVTFTVDGATLRFNFQ